MATKAEAIFVRPWLAALLVLVFVAAPSFFLAELVVTETAERLETSRLNEQARAARTAADIVASRLTGLRENLVAVANSRFTKDAIARQDAATLAILVHEFRPVLGLEDDVLIFFAANAEWSEPRSVTSMI